MSRRTTCAAWSARCGAGRRAGDDALCRAAGDRIAGRALGAAQINHSFLPGALLARALGRQDCLGATMALTRETLERVGGLHALAHHLADDAVLGQLVRAQG